MASNPKLPVSENWRWPDGLSPEDAARRLEGVNTRLTKERDNEAALVDQLRRDRDELVEALEECATTMWSYVVSTDGEKVADEEIAGYLALLARVKR